MENHIALVTHIAGELAQEIPGVPFEDLVGAGSVGLVEAAGRFDGRRGVKFSTFASWRIRGAMLDAVREWIGRANPETREEWPEGSEPGRELDPDLGLEGEDWLAWACKPLTATERAIVALRYRGDLTYPDIGIALGISAYRVGWLHRRALEVLRRRVEGNGG